MMNRWVFVGLYMFGMVASRYYTQFIFADEQMPYSLAFSFVENLFMFLTCCSMQYTQPKLHVKSLQLWGFLVGLFSVVCGLDFMFENATLNAWSVSMDAIVKSTCIVVTALIQLVYGQRISGIRWLLLIFTTLGVVLTMFDGQGEFQMLGFTLSFCAMLTSSLIAVVSDYILDRFAGTKPIHLLTFSSLISMYLIFPFFMAEEASLFFTKFVEKPVLMASFLVIDSALVALAQFSLLKIAELFGAVQITLVDALLVIAVVFIDQQQHLVALDFQRGCGIAMIITCFILDAFIK